MFSLLEGVSAGINTTFQAPLQAIFHPINNALGAINNPMVWKICAISLFIIPMIWVWVGLKKEYVNMDAPRKSPLYDLRIWTVISMMPHIFFYLVY